MCVSAGSWTAARESAAQLISFVVGRPSFVVVLLSLSSLSFSLSFFLSLRLSLSVLCTRAVLYIPTDLPYTLPFFLFFCLEYLLLLSLSLPCPLFRPLPACAGMDRLAFCWGVIRVACYSVRFAIRMRVRKTDEDNTAAVEPHPLSFSPPSLSPSPSAQVSRLFLPSPRPPRPSYELLMLGWEGAGKSTLLAVAANDPEANQPPPTKGQLCAVCHSSPPHALAPTGAARYRLRPPL